MNKQDLVILTDAIIDLYITIKIRPHDEVSRVYFISFKLTSLNTGC